MCMVHVHVPYIHVFMYLYRDTQVYSLKFLVWGSLRFASSASPKNQMLHVHVPVHELAHINNVCVSLTDVVTNGHLMDSSLRVFDRLPCFCDLGDKVHVRTCTCVLVHTNSHTAIRGPDKF